MRDVPVIVSVLVVSVYPNPEMAVSPETIGDGVFLKATGKVSEHDVTIPEPTMSLDLSIAPVIEGELPHELTVIGVPVASQYPAPR